MSDRGMLSRLAESLYWIGRYVERADDTARIIDSYVHRLVEAPTSEQDEIVRSLFSILGVESTASGALTAADALAVLAYDAANPSAIAGALVGAYENARRSRDIISSERCRRPVSNSVRRPTCSSSESARPSSSVSLIPR